MDACLEDEDYCLYVQMLTAEKAGIMEDETDFEYKYFLNHLKKHGNSYLFETKDDNNGLTLSVKYEGTCQTFQDAQLEFQGNIGSAYDEAHTFRRSKRRPVLEPTFLRSKMIRESIDKATPLKREFDDLGGESLLDDSYNYFLKKARMDGASIIIELGNDKTIKYESVDESAFLSRSPPEKCGLDCKNEQLDDGRSSGDYDDDSCYYNKRLLAALSKPYSKDEHIELLAKVSFSKSVLQGIHLRSRDPTYPTGRKGKSYLDYHPNFARKLKRADRTKSLELLRGFFFWLQNSSYEGAFEPWLRSPYHDTCAL